jgi:spermidine/putrescine transport system substrate-binding protein
VFTEITSVLEAAPRSGEAEDFLEYLMEPETAWRAALTERTANPVAQMGMPEVFDRFSARDLDAIQWDSLEEDVSRCADYDLVPDHAALLLLLRNAVRTAHAPRA